MQISRPLSPCPDCGAKPDRRRHLQHAATCPLAAAVDAVTADDRRWFQERPEAPWRFRDIAPVEAAELRWIRGLPDTATIHGRIKVTQLEPGVRLRQLVDAYAQLGDVA